MSSSSSSVSSSGSTAPVLKYVPLDLNRIFVEYGMDCRKAYGNVYATSMEDQDAFICCGGNEASDEREVTVWEKIGLRYFFGNDALCATMPRYLPFLSHLSKFPHSWLLVFAPIALRMLSFYPIIYLESAGSEEKYSTFIQNRTFIRTCMRRIVLYLGIILFRAYVLYSFCDSFEDRFFAANEDLDNDNTCWYGNFLRRYSGESRNKCNGTAFDFSDHIVLFFGHLIPILMFEMSLNFVMENPEVSATKSKHARMIVNLLVAFISSYLILITLLSAFRTATYFHTPLESIIGYIVSMTVQLPLAFCICSNDERFMISRCSGLVLHTNKEN